MNSAYLEKAKSREPNVPRLINMVSRRVKQMIAGDRPLVKPDSLFMERMDLALKEIAEGKLTAEAVYVEKPEAAPETNLFSL